MKTIVLAIAAGFVAFVLYISKKDKQAVEAEVEKLQQDRNEFYKQMNESKV